MRIDMADQAFSITWRDCVDVIKISVPLKGWPARLVPIRGQDQTSI
jgi:hypothetical protein